MIMVFYYTLISCLSYSSSFRFIPVKCTFLVKSYFNYSCRNNKKFCENSRLYRLTLKSNSNDHVYDDDIENLEEDALEYLKTVFEDLADGY